jgi:hypothetical protein
MKRVWYDVKLQQTTRQSDLAFDEMRCQRIKTEKPDADVCVLRGRAS